MSKVILCCSCFRMDKKATEAYALLFPNEEQPTLIKGRDRIYKYAKKINNDHMVAISKLSGKYAYFIEFDGNNITKEYNLLTGQRIA